MSSPSRRMRPSVGVSNPASIRNNVVLPQPEGPSSAKNSSCPISSESASTAATEPNRLVTASKRTSGCFSFVAGPCAALPPSAIESPFRGITLPGREKALNPARLSVLLRQRASNRITPAGILALPRFEIHARLEATVELPLRGKPLEIGTDTGGPSRQVGRAERGCFHDDRPIDGTSKNISDILHRNVAHGHPAVDTQHRRRGLGGRPVGMHGFEKIARLIGNCFQRRAGKIGRTGVAAQAKDGAARLRI